MSDAGGNDNLCPDQSGPLLGFKVIELGSTVAGPFCARLFADFGASVIKVEQKEGDAVRGMGKEKDGRSLYGATIFRNKKIISIDLRNPEGRKLVQRLCKNADIVVENFRPGTLEKWGLGYDDLSKENPGLVLVRISGYGQTGRYSQRPGYGVVCEAFSGLREITGDPDRPPARVAVSMTDYITGLYAAFGAVMALVDRNKSGQGQVIDAALYESAFSFMEPHIPSFQQLGHIATRSGSRLPNHTPNSLYISKDKKYIHITAGSQTVFKRLTEAMGRPELFDDKKFSTQRSRSKNEDLIDEIVNEWTSSINLTDLEKILESYSVPASRIYNMEDIFNDPHYADRNMLVNVQDDVLGPVAMANVVPKLSRTPGAVKWAGHETGKDTREILTNELGLSSSEISALEKAQVIYSKLAT